ncbi:MAG: sensor histidine kinase KdpD [Syntrophomonadaceae bacterium]|nr:sensor histidine kinase KdpD [Syntrophomonadaceae bacterium]
MVLLNDKRADPDALLASMKPKGRGRLTVFLGAAAGVGKTYAMLEAARERINEGADVVIGWVETHGRKETEALLKGLKILPPRPMDYRDKHFQELDLDALLARRPDIVLIDELAHTNIPGSRHIKRYQDVEEVLAAGIDVYTTVNIQHLESINDIVARITGISVHETVPDTALKQAEIQLIDIPTEDLLQRLHEGKVYVPDQVAEAVKKFFRAGNINALREMSLRYTAQIVDSQMQTYMRAHAIEGPWPAGERVMVCISTSPFATKLIRVAHRMATGLKAELLVVYVETPEAGSNGTVRDRLFANLRLAEELGGEIISTSGTDIAAELLQIARSRNVTQVVIGKPLRSRFLELLRGSVVDKVIRHSEGFSIHVIPGQAIQDADSSNWLQEKTRKSLSFLPYLKVILMIGLITVVIRPFIEQLGLVNVAMIYLLPVLYSAVKSQRRVSLTAVVGATLALDFFYIPPQLSLSVADLRYLLSFFIFGLVAWLTSSMASRLRKQIDHAHQREAMMGALYSLSRGIGASDGMEEVMKTAIKKLAEVTGGEVIILIPADGKLELRASSGILPKDELSDNERAVASWVLEHGKMAGKGTDTLIGADLLYLPLSTEDGAIGVLGIRYDEGEGNWLREKKRFIEALANLTAIAINRVQLAEKARQIQVAADSERLRTALFNSISHDLRTPLTSILGAATGLLEEEQLYDEDSRRALLENIRQGALRMHRLVNNLLDMARLESGFLQLNKEYCDIQDIIGVAVQRVESLNSLTCTIEIESDLPMVEVDFVLIEQVVVNLLDNAVKYSGEQQEITISARRWGKRVEVAVADRGPGILVEDREKIFSSFYRLQNSGNVKGTGLGLAICKSIIEAHEGDIEAQDNPGGGAIIRFSLAVTEEKHINIPE